MLLAAQPQLQDQILSLLNNWPGQLLSATIAIGFLVMTIISYFKFDFRIRFHKRAIESWLDLKSSTISKVATELDQRAYFNTENDWRYRYTDLDDETGICTLLKLTIAGDGKALYSLNISSLSGQLALGAQTLLDTPDRYPMLLARLAGYGANGPQLEAEYWTVLDNELNYKWRNEKSDQDFNLGDQPSVYAKNRLSAHIQRRIDSFQVRTAFRWKRKLRIISLSLSIGLSVIGSTLFAQSGNFFGILLISILIGYLGGFLAGLLHELISVIKSQRK